MRLDERCSYILQNIKPNFSILLLNYSANLCSGGFSNHSINICEVCYFRFYKTIVISVAFLDSKSVQYLFTLTLHCIVSHCANLIAFKFPMLTITFVQASDVCTQDRFIHKRNLQLPIFNEHVVLTAKKIGKIQQGQKFINISFQKKRCFIICSIHLHICQYKVYKRNDLFIWLSVSNYCNIV